MNKQQKKFDVNKMTEFKPSETIQFQDDFGLEDSENIQEKYVKYDQSAAKAFNLID